MNYYQHHIGDFIRDTARLSDSQCMAYLRLIWHYYDTEQPFECDIDALAFSIGASEKDVELILKHYFFQHEGRWHHARCDKEILAFRSKSQKAKDSANARWENANAMRTKSERKANAHENDANQEPVTNNQSKDKYSDEFEKAWSSYPRKGDTNKKASFKAWCARLKSGATPEQIIAGVQRYAAYCAANGTEQKFIKQPQTFFGPDEHYLLDWTQQRMLKKQPTGKQSARDNYAAEAAAARQKGEGNERDITGECTVIS